MKRSVFILTIPMLLLSFGIGRAEESCIKTVFEDYCLGGDFNRQLERTPTKMRPEAYGERQGVIYMRDAEKIYVMAYKGIIYKILHTFEPVTPVTLRDLRRRLQRKYGNYRDLSEYPEETKNTAKQMSFIRRGEGELKHVWQPPGQPWRVELSWTRKLGVAVSYYVNVLDEQQKEAALRGL